MSDVILSDSTLSSSAFSHVIAAPIEKVDIAEWLFALPEAEYQRCCPPDHISCGATFTDDGTRMSINVEMIGRTLMIQHYVAETATPHLCRMVSTSDAFTPNGHTRVQVIWTLSVRPIDDGHCEYTNSVVAHPTAAFMDFIAQHGMSFEQAAAARQHDGGDHNADFLASGPLTTAELAAAVGADAAALRRLMRMQLLNAISELYADDGRRRRDSHYQSTARPADAFAVLAPALQGFTPTREMPEIAEAKVLLAALATTSRPRSTMTALRK